MKHGMSLAPRAASQFRPGSFILDCSGPIHRSWIQENLLSHHLKVILYRRDFSTNDVTELPHHSALQMVSGNLDEVLHKMRDSVSLLVDDVGSFHFHEQPLELLKRYYDALSWDGEAWIRFPKSFWVFLEDNHRVSLQDYLVMKFPLLAMKLRAADLAPDFSSGTSSGEGWVRLKKDRIFPKLFFHLQPRSLGGTAFSGESHSPVLEFIERPNRNAVPFKKVA